MTAAVRTPYEGSGLAGVVRAITVIAQRDLIRQLKHPGMLLTQAMQMFFVVVVFGIGFNSMVRADGGLPFSAYVFPGIIAIQVVTVGMNAGLGYAWDREFGILKEMSVAPVPKVCMAGGKVVATGVTVSVQAAAMLLVSPLLAVRLTPGALVGGVLAYALTGMVFAGIGLLLATSIRRVQTLQSSVALTMFPMLFLSGSVFRPENLPDWLAALIAVNPMSYAVDLVRHIVLTGGQFSPIASLGTDVLVLLGIGVLSAVCIRIRVGP